MLTDSKRTKAHTRSQGNQAEEYVAHWLGEQGFTIQAKNFRQFYGEIDLIATKHEVIAFVEVKCRTTAHFNLSEVITHSKQQKIIKTALAYLAQHPMPHKIYRFDVALVHQSAPDTMTLNYIPNAFTYEPRHNYELF